MSAIKPVEKPRKIVPDRRIASLLPGASFCDSYQWSMGTSDGKTDASAIADSLFGTSPPWVDWLMKLRNTLARLVNIKPAETSGFPVQEKHRDRLILGFDDWHLDFRIAILLDPIAADRSLVTLGTIVRTHNMVGQIYLFGVKPFHHLIVHSLINRIRPL